MEVQPSNEVSNSIPISPPKRGRGRPPKYTPEEREEHHKKAVSKWQQEHKEEYSKHRKEYYKQNSDSIQQQNIEYQTRARNALKILGEMLDSGTIEIKDERHKAMVCDLIKNKKIIYI